MNRKLAMALLAISLASPVALTGCNTVAGIGRDVSATGQAVTNAAGYANPAPGHYYRETYRSY